jgi:integrase
MSPAGKSPILAEDLRAMLGALPATTRGARDRALLLVCWLGAFRRSELAGLDVADVQFAREGLLIVVRRSKADQDGRGTLKALPYGASPDLCPVRALQNWIETARVDQGPLFRPVSRHGRVGESRLTGHAVALVVKRAAAAAGLDPKRLSGHSLRAGFATAAALAGKPHHAIKAMTAHKSDAMLARYMRAADAWRDNAASGLLER